MNTIYLKLMATTIFGMFLSACGDGARKSPELSLDALNAKMEESGWSYLERLGDPGESETETILASKTSRTVTAFWFTKGMREEKVYQQTDTLYAVVSHQKPSGDTSAIVFIKSKP